MIRFHKLYIKGFKSPKREINFEFADGAITVIYGKNGSGKTTLLRVLRAILQKDIRTLFNEKVQDLKLEYSINGENKTLHFFLVQTTVDDTERQKEMLMKFDSKTMLWKVVGKNKDGNVFHLFVSNWEGYDETLMNTSSIFFGIHRGISEIFQKGTEETTRLMLFEEIEAMEREMQKRKIRRDPLEFEGYHEAYYRLSRIAKRLHRSEEKIETSQHEFHDFVTIKAIEKSVLDYYQQGREKVMEQASNAFFESIEIFETQVGNSFDLPEGIQKRVESKKDFIGSALEKQNKSTLREKLEKYIANFDSAVLDTPMSRALLLNILEKAEEPNPELEAVQALQRIFNDHLAYGKRLEITNESLFIRLDEEETHDLNKLSSGERNLLSMLTLFLIVGRGRDFLMIDEPENSLHLDWQEHFLPLVQKMNPNAQIIVATHSPAIAPNTKALKELI